MPHSHMYTSLMSIKDPTPCLKYGAEYLTPTKGRIICLPCDMS